MRESERDLTARLVDEMQQRFQPQHATDRRGIALELEFPTVAASGGAVAHDKIRALFGELEREGWVLHRDGGTGEIIEATQSLSGGRGRFGFDRDVVGTDTGFCTIETALTPEDNIFKLRDHWVRMKSILLPILAGLDAQLLGYGVQPLSRPSVALMAQKGRYHWFRRDSPNRFIDQRDGVDMDLSNITASNQVHIDIYREEAIRAVNTMIGLAPLLSALTANAPVWQGQVDDQFLDVRELMQDLSAHHLLPHVGMPEAFVDYEDYVNRLLEFHPLMVQRNEEYFRVVDCRTFGHFMAKGEDNWGETVTGKRVRIAAQNSDLLFFSGMAWWNARLAIPHGSLEVRPCGQQPDEAMLVVAAISLGIVQNLDQAWQLYQRYPHNTWRKLRFDAIRHGLQAELEDGSPILPLAAELLEIAKQGLEHRGLGEEVFLKPLFDRVDKRECPADNVKRAFLADGIQGLLELTVIRDE